EDLREYRVAVAPDVVALAPVVRHMLVGLGLPDRGDVVRRVEARELLRRRDRAVEIAPLVEPARGADQVEGRRHPRDRQRMPPAVGRRAIDLAADEERAAGHLARPARTAAGRQVCARLPRRRREAGYFGNCLRICAIMLCLLGARMVPPPFPPPRERPTAGQPYRIDLMPEFIRR